MAENPRREIMRWRQIYMNDADHARKALENAERNLKHLRNECLHPATEPFDLDAQTLHDSEAVMCVDCYAVINPGTATPASPEKG